MVWLTKLPVTSRPLAGAVAVDEPMLRPPVMLLLPVTLKLAVCGLVPLAMTWEKSRFPAGPGGPAGPAGPAAPGGPAGPGGPADPAAPGDPSTPGIPLHA